ncbi:cell division transport system ATP-binding protein [Acetoanaerobium pronyense]|uniref:Cell division ATP-binding protein FtsE n=1 Tax=Acetoanaerobium pronyense TaxID=1482736 RepID=A0ABS4KMV3_9FIRM|nr:cell division transport system ATP-binding protein [Acetoanaerobium pronyense]
MIKFEGVTKIYKGEKVALDNVDIDIKKGEFVFLVGSSGAGKSTFMKLLLKEEEPTEGTITINEIQTTKLSRRKVPKLRRSMGIIFQDFRLLPNKTVYENIAFAMEITGNKAKDIRRKVPSVLSMVGLSDKAKSYPAELSGGEQQRVGIARAIINNPSLLIADEPTGNLDPVNASEIMRILKDINKRGTTVLVATHAKELVDKMQQRVIALDHGKVVRDVERGLYNDAK